MSTSYNWRYKIIRGVISLSFYRYPNSYTYMPYLIKRVCNHYSYPMFYIFDIFNMAKKNFIASIIFNVKSHGLCNKRKMKIFPQFLPLSLCFKSSSLWKGWSKEWMNASSVRFSHGDINWFKPRPSMNREGVINRMIYNFLRKRKIKARTIYSYSFQLQCIHTQIHMHLYSFTFFTQLKL